MTRWLVIICLVLNTAVASAQEPLSTEDKRLLRWFDVATLGDAVTTVVGLGCATVREVNPLLAGANPLGVAGFFVVRNLLHRELTEWIQPRHREIWLWSSIGAQSTVVVSNVLTLAEWC